MTSTSPSNIPDEAVEAAARMVYETSGRSRQMPYSAAEFACKLEAKKILEAAAPHLMAAALREAADRVTDQEGRFWAEGRQRAMWLRKLADRLVH